MKTEKQNWLATGIFIGLSVVSVAIVGGVIWLMNLLPVNLSQPEIILPILIISSLAVLLTILGILSAIMGALGMSDSRFALGMPEGSIRAVIALSLLLIFVVSSLYLFNGFEYSSLSKGLPEPQFNALFEKQSERIVFFQARKEEGVTVYDVRLKTEVGESSKNFAIQILSVVGTLVGAVSGFYFGSKALATARGITTISSQPSITRVHPNVIKVSDEQPKEQTILVFGANLISAAVVKLKRENDTDIVATKFRPVSDKQIECTFDIAGKSVGDWILCVINADGGEIEYKEPFTLKAD